MCISIVVGGVAVDGEDILMGLSVGGVDDSVGGVKTSERSRFIENELARKTLLVLAVVR